MGAILWRQFARCRCPRCPNDGVDTRAHLSCDIESYGGPIHPWRIGIEGDEIQAESFEMVPSLAHLKVR